MIQFRNAIQSELNTVAEIITASTEGYPFNQLTNKTNWQSNSPITTKEESQSNLLYRLNLVNATIYHNKHQCIVGTNGDNIVAVALLKLKDTSIPKLSDYIKAGCSKLISEFGLKTVLPMIKIILGCNHTLKCIKEPYWYIDTLSVITPYENADLHHKQLEEYITTYITRNGGGKLARITNSSPERKLFKKRGYRELKELITTIDGNKVGIWSLSKTLPYCY